MSAETKNDFQDDPRITAYALGELDDLSTEEQREIEARLEREPALRAHVDEMRATAELLETELADENTSGLSDEQRHLIEQRIESGGGRRTPFALLRGHPVMAVASAAALLAIVSVAAVQTRLFQRPTPVSAPFTYSVFGETAADEAREPVAVAAVELAQADSSNYLKAGVSTQLSETERSQLNALGYGAGEGAPAESEAPARDRKLAKSERGLADTRKLQFESIDKGALERLKGLGYVGHGVDPDREAYDAIVENDFQLATQDPLSTFSIDVDTASYANTRRFLSEGRLPPPDAVRIEELVNYFPYRYAGPEGGAPFAVHVEVGSAPWAPDHRLVRIGLKGREVPLAERKASNLVFLLDVSGSMNRANKLPLLKKALHMLVQNLDERDTVAIVVYAGSSGLVLPPTTCDYKEAILQSLERLKAGGSTNGGAGIELAYGIAAENFIVGGINRVVLATDGDFNVGTTDQGSLVRLIEAKAKTGVFLSVLGFGMGNLNDATLEQLADKGNGNYAYIDGVLEAKKVLVQEMGATLETIAKDVKIQVEFNPQEVQGYRLIGYENRLLAAQDFNDDTKDAGEIGAGHTVTALYEIVPAGRSLAVPGVDPLKYQSTRQPSGAAFSGELLTVKLRFKAPDGDTSELIEMPVEDAGDSFFETSDDTRFAAAVAAFGMILRESRYKGTADLEQVRAWALESAGEDEGGYRTQFIELVRKAAEIGGR